MNKAIFIDKDGTLIKDIPYNINPEKMKLNPGAVDLLRYAQKKGYKIIIISNQSGVARGLFKENELKKAIARLEKLLNKRHISIDDFLYCPHHPEGKIIDYAFSCDCRKPSPGLIMKAKTKYNIDTSQSWMIGDILNDIEAGNNAGCYTALVHNGGETIWETGNATRLPHVIVSRLDQLIKII